MNTQESDCPRNRHRRVRGASQESDKMLGEVFPGVQTNRIQWQGQELEKQEGSQLGYETAKLTRHKIGQGSGENSKAGLSRLCLAPLIPTLQSPLP